MLIVVSLIVILAAMVVIDNWRYGVVLVLLLGLLQDPLRKLATDTPAYYTVGAAGLFVLVLLVAYLRGAFGSLKAASLYDRRLFNAWMLFIFIVLIQAAHALVRTGNPLMPGLGIAFYLGPFAALLFAIAYFRSYETIKSFFYIYIILFVPAALTVYLSVYYSDSWPILRDIGTFAGIELRIYDIGTVLSSHPGTFRAGEIAAWHAATAASFLVLIAGERNKTILFRVVAAALVVALLGAIILTGRRKMLMAFTTFIVLHWGLLAYHHRNQSRYIVFLIILGVAGSFAYGWFQANSESQLYLQRGVTVFEDVYARIQVALNLLYAAYLRAGVLGFGAGTTAQGLQHFGGGLASAGGAAEAGIGKLLVELGLPGLTAVIWIVLLLVLRIGRALSMMSNTNERLFHVASAMSAVLIANLLTFLVAAQLYGDLFILIVIGLMAGILFVCAMQTHYVPVKQKYGVYSWSKPG